MVVTEDRAVGCTSRKARSRMDQINCNADNVSSLQEVVGKLRRMLTASLTQRAKQHQHKEERSESVRFQKRIVTFTFSCNQK